jgi:alkylation response protein AidB-like acyl-CoA dehydrogenase
MYNPSPQSAPPAVDPLEHEDSIRDAVDEIQSSGDIPQKLYEELRESSAFRMLTPREYGGLEMPLTTVMKVYEAFGRIEASVAWTVWNANFGFIAALLPESGAARVWEGGEPAFANSGMPGQAERIEDGFRVSGRWKMVSGVKRADWVALVAAVTEGGSTATTETGAPDLRIFLVHRGGLRILDTWDASGMRATGSHDVSVEGAVVPDDLVVPIGRPARIDRTLYRGYLNSLVLPGCTAITLGVAQAAMDELARLAPAKKDLSGRSLAESALTRVALARSESALRAARLLLYDVLQGVETSAGSGGDVTAGQRHDLLAAMAHAAEVCREVLVTMYSLSSSTSVYRGNVMERLFRDGMVALQHANHSGKHFEAVGAFRLRGARSPQR